ncbi:MAG TPA: magnesium transporter CorA family protein [Dehalococcoidia bacterium]|nr:magnesium transporter CorA family protein [Dehalococcoidia bacterium]
MVRPRVRRRKAKKAEVTVAEPKLNVETLTWEEMTWVNIEGPTTRETEFLSENYGFHPLDLDDCLSRIQRPKIDEYPDYLFMVFHFPVFNVQARVTTPSQVSVFIGKDYLITLHKGDLKPLVKLFRECQLEEEARQENLSGGSGQLLYQIIDRLVDYCLPILNKIGDNIERVDEEIFAQSMPRAIKDISILRRDVISFRRIIWPLRAVAASLKSKVSRFTKTDMGPYFDDMVDHIDKIWDGLDEYKEIIEGLNDTHDSLATNRTNEVVRMLTVIATIMLPITVVASIFGMNIPLGPFGNSPLSALYVTLICLGIIIGMLYFFRLKRWI